MITAKKDGSIKLALDAKPVNAQNHKNKYQMPVVDEFLTKVSSISEAKPEQGVWFTKLDLNYAYSQLPLSKETSKHCNFSISEAKLRELIDLKPGSMG